jgi:hypothetical protein
VSGTLSAYVRFVTGLRRSCRALSALAPSKNVLIQADADDQALSECQCLRSLAEGNFC